MLLIIFGVITIAIAAFSMLARENIKKLIAFSSVEHMGLILLGIGLGTPVVLFWVLFHILGHALTKSLLFFSAGILRQQYHSNRYLDMKNVLALQPLASAGIIIGSVAVIGTPMFPLFLSKFYILSELAGFSGWLLFIVLLLLLMVAASFALFMVRTFSQAGTDEAQVRYRASLSMKFSIIAQVGLLVALGVFFPLGLANMLKNIVASLGF